MSSSADTAILSRIARIVGGVLVCSFFYTPLAFAETKIHEVQPWPVDGPTQLIIWGTEFGTIDAALDTPMIHFGTSSTQLDIPADQSLCYFPLGGVAPPLEAGFDCVVADLPAVDNGEPNVPAGDYLLAIWVEGLEECTEKPSSLTFEYNPSDCSGFNLQGAFCSGNMTGSAGPAVLTAVGHNNADWVVTSSPVANGGSVVFTGDDKWPNELILNMSEGAFSQDIQLHTSCSQPLAIGDVFGSMTLTDMVAATSPSMHHDLYDLTLGATGPEGPQGKEGPQGEQGKIGPQGEQGKIGPQGEQGKLGDQGEQGKLGDQGEQGKIGPPGEQGEQGKIGPQGEQGKLGDQGPQGKLGDQGPQGKLGDQGPQGKDGAQGPQGKDGAQGPQGKLGDQGPQGKLGDQGPQGKLGDQGPQGKPGPQGPQGKLGDQGPQGKLGAQGPQGKDGAQGPQGKLGDQGPQGKLGDQGPQGKLGDQGPQGKLGDQGPQGKLGDQGPQGKLGDQGPQGKLGDQGPQGKDGAQGPQGKLGDQGPQGKLGDQGPQGKLGPQGDQGKIGPPGEDGEDGADGIGANLLCFATDQTIGSTGKYMGIGQQAGEHASVSVIVPFESGTVSTLVVKASQGGGTSSGQAWLYHDATPFDEDGEVASNECTLDATPNTSICFIDGADVALALNELDSLSVFVSTDGGSFEGASACVLIEDPVVATGPPLPVTTQKRKRDN